MQDLITRQLKVSQKITLLLFHVIPLRDNNAIMRFEGNQMCANESPHAAGLLAQRVFPGGAEMTANLWLQTGLCMASLNL